MRTNSRSASLWFPVVLRKALVLLLFQTTAESSSGFGNGLCHVKTRNQLSRTCPLCKGKRAGLFFVVFVRFQKSLGPRQPHKHDTQLSERVLTTRKRTKTEHKLVTASVLLRCTVTGCSWLPDLVCCSKTAFSAKQSRFAQQSTANPGPAARYGALGTPRPLASGLIKSRVAS